MEMKKDGDKPAFFDRCTGVFAELMLDKITSSLDRENLHEVFLTLIKIQRNNKNKYYICNFRKKNVGFYCFTTSPCRTQANHFNKIHLHILIIIQPYILKK